MSKDNVGGAAFPTYKDSLYLGMSLRDYFAAKAMQALIEKTELMIQATLENDEVIGSTDDFLAVHKAGICESAYKYADAMLKAREE
jgi:glycerol kinase